MYMYKKVLGLALAVGMFSVALPVFADTVGPIDFESGYDVGSVNGQATWSSTGSYDQSVVDASVYGIPLFGTKAFRISNAVTSGSFGDQTFSPSVANEAGETSAVNDGKSGGTRQNHFDVQFSIASASTTEQTGLAISVSPDRGDGARMSYLRFVDQADGIHVFFDDYSSGDFRETDVATLDRSASHTIRFAMDFVDGTANDIVKIYIDDALVHTGTSWEDYFRNDEHNPTRTVDSLLFRAAGTAVPANAGYGFLFDNFNFSSSASVAPTAVYVKGTYTGPVGTSLDSHTVGVDAFATVQAGVNAVVAGGTVNILPGDYNLVKDDTTVVSEQTGWYLAITKAGITLQGVNAGGQPITNAADAVANIYSTQETVNGAWPSQNLITVFANNVTIQGLVIMNKLSPNKGIEVLGNNFTAQYDRFTPIPLSILPTAANYTDPDGSIHNDISKYGSGVYFNNNGATEARTGTVTNNKFENSGVTFDSFVNNWTVNVANNVFDGNKQWDTSYYSSVGATTWAGQLNFTGSTINIQNNKFINMASDQIILKIRSDMTGSFGATPNYWGSTGGPAAANLLGDISFSPWFSDSDMTTLRYTTTSSEGEASTTVDSEVSQTETTPNGDVNIVITAGTVVTGPDTWDGTINAPTVTTTTVAPIADSGNDASTVGSIEVGFGDTILTFDNAVQLVFVGQAGNSIGYSHGAGTFHQITAVCTGNNDEPTQTANLAVDADCKISNDGRGNLVVWTKHFSTFTTYTQSATPPSGGGGGGSSGNGAPVGTLGIGGSFIPGLAVAGSNSGTGTGTGVGTGSTSGGEVLGAAAYNFGRNLALGSRGADVDALQQILIDGGFLKIASPTGYFGALTRTAVIAFQAKYSIAQVGLVGPQTRAQLNKGSTGGSHSNLTPAQKQSILDVLRSFGADASIINNVNAAL